MQYKSPAPGGKFLGHVHGHQLIKPSLSQGPKASAPFMVTMALLPHRNPISQTLRSQPHRDWLRRTVLAFPASELPSRITTHLSLYRTV